MNRWLAQAMLRLPRSWLAASLKSAYPKPAHRSAREYLQERLRNMDGDAIRRERAEVNRFDLRARLGEVRAPTLILVGDLFGRMARSMAEESARGIAGARLVVLPGGGDPSNLLVPEAFDREVLPFLRKGQR